MQGQRVIEGGGVIVIICNNKIHIKEIRAIFKTV